MSDDVALCMLDEGKNVVFKRFFFVLANVMRKKEAILHCIGDDVYDKVHIQPRTNGVAKTAANEKKTHTHKHSNRLKTEEKIGRVRKKYTLIIFSSVQI